MQKQRLIILIIGVVLAVVTVFMIKSYLEQQRQNIAEQAEKKAAAEAKQMQEKQMRAMQEQAARARVSSQEQGGAGLASITPVGKRAITIFVENAASLSGMIKPRDNVDVLGVMILPAQGSVKKQTEQTIIPLFQNVLVLAVGQETNRDPVEQENQAKKPGKKDDSSFITLALTSEEANLIAFVQEQGKIRLVLRSPTDSQVETIKPVNWETIFQYIKPVEEAVSSGEIRPKVQIYRGLKKEEVPLAK